MSSQERSRRASLASGNSCSDSPKKPAQSSAQTRASLFYKPFSVLNPISKENIGCEDEMALDFPFKEAYWDGSFNKMSSDNSYQKKSSSDNMEVDDEPSLNLTPWTRLREFQNWVHHFQTTLEEVDIQDLNDPHKCAEYAWDIHSNMRIEEMKY